VRRLALLCALVLLGSQRARAVSLVYELSPAPGGALRLVERGTPAERASISAGLPDLEGAPAALTRWVDTAGRAVTSFYGRFPVPRATVSVHLVGRGAISGGHTVGDAEGARVDVNVGPGLTREELDGDWVLTHELVHTAMPRLPRSATWLDEGLATYVEPIARARVGAGSADKVWGDLGWGLPKGLPTAGDEGLDRTHTWGRTYWGGALFAFLADLELRAASGNRVSLREALIGVLAEGGNVTVSWSLERVLGAMDRATRGTVLRDLHARMGTAPVDPQVPAIFRRLGVTVSRSGVRYDDQAPLAATRRLLPTGDVVR